MRVAFISRATLYSTPGGDTKQLDMTAHYLRELGVEVDVCLTNQPIEYEKYDLLHFFNIIRPADILGHVQKSGKPFAVSTIFLDYGDFEKKARGGLMKWMNKIFSEDQIEYIKAVARWAKNGEKIGSMNYLLWGHKKSVKWVANNAQILLPNSENEYRRFAKKYNIEHAYRVVPNGIDASVADKVKTSRINDKYDGAVLCVARIEGRKNQLNLIRAMNNTPYKVFIHGKPSPNNIGYYEQCKAEAADNIHFTTWLTEEELYEMYHSAKVHILPSYFETTGLSSLEAAVMGCNIVVTDKGDTKDYFDGYAWFCDPDDTDSIREAVVAAHEAPYNEAFRDKILKDYTWMRAAEETLAAYKQVLQQ
ncbi:MAG: glycosyltransferase family 4 protein [Chitinophagales bacterium]|nr:glycosyltransferase family 4 protein [Chitinophagaceae bacterium]MCB9063654.1 glycosyltransferase family 4 protein [Chitinophagales bacterium]